MPASSTDDATFARRLYLDLLGRIPTTAEVRAFLNDKEPNKRAKLAVRLMATPAHARHMATFWRREWIPQAEIAPLAKQIDDLEGWLEARLQENAGYDRIVRSLLTASRTGTKQGIPVAFLVASDYLPENLAANTTRAFLGINLDCAQCHNHPFARWTRDQFWQTAAFFTRPERRPTSDKIALAIPNTTRTVGPKLLDDQELKWPKELKESTGRELLADWVTSKRNPYFAKNAVNRLWANYFGTALVEPLDDLSGQNPASHPELLDELTHTFAESGFDLKYLTAALIQTKAYQLSSALPEGGSAEPRLFARAPVRGLTGLQLYDSLRIAAGLSAERDDLDSSNARSERTQFATVFRIDRPATAQRSILQALSLMNGKLTAELSDLGRSPTLRGVAEAPFLDGKGKIETLFLAVLARKPTPAELEKLAAYLDKGGVDRDDKKALADIFWALLNSTEFTTNH